MKKLLLLSFILAYSGAIFGQSDSPMKYKNFISGRLHVQLANTDANNTDIFNFDENRFSFGISTGLGRQINHHISNIFNINYRYSQAVTPLFIDNTWVRSSLITSTIGVSNSIRYTINPEDKLQFAIQPGISYSYSNNRREVESELLDDFRFFSHDGRLFISPLLTYQFTDRVRFTTSIGSLRFNVTSRKVEGNNNRTNSFSANAVLQSSIGGIGIEFLF